MAKAAAPSESPSTPAEWLRVAVKKIGGQSATSRLTGLSQQAVSYRLSKGLPCWPEHVLVVEAETKRLGCEVSRHDLRPDLHPREAEPVSLRDRSRGTPEKAR